jgi:hypothetical protein
MDNQLCRTNSDAEVGRNQQKVSLLRVKFGEDSVHGTPPPAQTFLLFV